MSFSTSSFYRLPKVYKSKQPDDLTVRSIVGGPNCHTRPLSQLIDLF